MKVTLSINATGEPSALAHVLRQIADELTEAGDNAVGIARVLMDGGEQPLGEMRVEEANDDGNTGR